MANDAARARRPETGGSVAAAELIVHPVSSPATMSGTHTRSTGKRRGCAQQQWQMACEWGGYNFGGFTRLAIERTRSCPQQPR